MKNEFGITVLSPAGFNTKGTKRAKVYRLLAKGGTVGEYKARVYKAFPEDPAALATRVLAAAVDAGFVKVGPAKKAKAAAKKAATAPKAAVAA
jgi:hypothetical protein